MKKTITIIAIVVLLGLGIAIFNKPVVPSNANEIKLGSILILSGEGASWGEASKNGIDLAVEDINKAGGINGKRFRVIHEDNMSDPKKAISAFQKLTDTDGVKFIIGPNWSNSGLPLVDIVKEKKVVMVSPSLGLKEFNESNEYLFNTWPHDNILSRNLADYVYKKGYRNIALLGGQDVWVKDQTKNFSERFIELGGKIAITYEPKTDEKDVRTDILKIKADKSIDAVVLTAGGYSLIDVEAEQIRGLGIKLPMFSITIDKKLITNCKGACDGMTFLTFLTPTSEFEKKYQDKFNREVEIGADSAYDAVMMIADAMKKSGTTDPQAVSKVMSEVKSYNGASGALSSDGKRAFTKPYLIKKVIGSVPVTITE